MSILPILPYGFYVVKRKQGLLLLLSVWCQTRTSLTPVTIQNLEYVHICIFDRAFLTLVRCWDERPGSGQPCEPGPLRPVVPGLRPTQQRHLQAQGQARGPAAPPRSSQHQHRCRGNPSAIDKEIRSDNVQTYL